MTYDVSYTLKGLRRFAFGVTESKAKSIRNKITDYNAANSFRVDVFDGNNFIETVDANWNKVQNIKTWKAL